MVVEVDNVVNPLVQLLKGHSHGFRVLYALRLVNYIHTSTYMYTNVLKIILYYNPFPYMGKGLIVCVFLCGC